MDRRPALPVLRDRHLRKPDSFMRSPRDGFEMTTYWLAYSICGLAVVIGMCKVKVDISADLDAVFGDYNRWDWNICECTAGSKPSFILNQNKQHMKKLFRLDGPDDDHITVDRFSHFSNKEIHVRTSHTNAYNGYWDTLVSACDSQKSSLRSKLKGLWFLIQ